MLVNNKIVRLTAKSSFDRLTPRKNRKVLGSIKMKKRVFTIILAVMMATVMAVPSFAFAAENAAADTDGAKAAEENTVQGVKTQVVTRISLKVTWDRTPGADGYIVYSYNKADNKYKKLKTITSGKTTKYTAKKLTSNKKYYYSVQSYDVKKSGKKVYSKRSKVVSGKTPKKLTPQTKGFSKTPSGIVRAVAKSKKGCAYVHGTAGPNSFDCSGYVYWVYNKSAKVKGLHLKKFWRGSAKDEYNQLRKYNIGRNINNAQPGDIVFYAHNGSTSSIHHVALYYGNGKIIHASSPSTGVIIQPASASGPIAAIVRLPGM